MACNTLNDRLPSSIGTLRRLRAALILSPTSSVRSVRHLENHSLHRHSSLSFFHIYGKRSQQLHIFRNKMSKTSLQEAELASLPFSPEMDETKAVGQVTRLNLGPHQSYCARRTFHLICIDTFSFCFNAISIYSKECSKFNAALVYLFAVYYKYSEISTMTFSTLFLALNLLRSLEFLVCMYCSIFNLQHNF